MNKTQFAARFSLEDWNDLCLDSEFNIAIESEDFGKAEVISHRVLTSAPAAGSEHRHIQGRIDGILTVYLPAAKADLARVSAMPNAPKAIARAERRINELGAEVSRLRAKLANN